MVSLRCLLVVLASGSAVSAQSVSLFGGRVSLAGEASGTIAPEDEGYFNYSDYSSWRSTIVPDPGPDSPQPTSTDPRPSERPGTKLLDSAPVGLDGRPGVRRLPHRAHALATLTGPRS